MNITDASIPWDDPAWLSDNDEFKDDGRDNIKSKINSNLECRNDQLNLNFTKCEEDEAKYSREFKQFTINNPMKNKTIYSQKSNFKNKGYSEKSMNHSDSEFKRNHKMHTFEKYKERSNDVQINSFERHTKKSSRKNKYNDATQIKVVVGRERDYISNDDRKNERRVYINSDDTVEQKNAQLCYYNINIKSTVESKENKNLFERRNNENYKEGNISSVKPIIINDNNELKNNINDECYRVKNFNVESCYNSESKNTNINATEDINDVKYSIYNQINDLQRNDDSIIQDVTNRIDKVEEYNEPSFQKKYNTTEFECNNSKYDQSTLAATNQEVKYDYEKRNNHASNSKRPAIEIYNPVNVRGKWSSLFADNCSETYKRRQRCKDIPQHGEIKSNYNGKLTEHRKINKSSSYNDKTYRNHRDINIVKHHQDFDTYRDEQDRSSFTQQHFGRQ